MLTIEEKRRLRQFRWKYSLESAGFTTKQAEQLLFLKWYYAHDLTS